MHSVICLLHLPKLENTYASSWHMTFYLCTVLRLRAAGSAFANQSKFDKQYICLIEQTIEQTLKF